MKKAMKKAILVNITSWMFVGSAGAEHYYAKFQEVETDDPHQLARDIHDGERYLNEEKVELQRTFKDKKEVARLNKKDDTDMWEIGMTTIRMDSIDQIKETAKEQFPECDIIFLVQMELKSEDDVFIVNPQKNEDIKKTGEKIKINGFQGFSKEFVHLTEGSIHEVIETPKKYKNKELQRGVWVMGVTEPVLVLNREYVTI